MKPFPQSITIAILLWMPGLSGCGKPSSAPLATPLATPAEKIAVDKPPERSSSAVETPQPMIEISVPPEWTKGDVKPLPFYDHGFSVAYHLKPTTVTLYQYTRRLEQIPSDVQSPLIRKEMNLAIRGIQDSVQSGSWHSAREKGNTTVKLGDSEQQVLWSQFELSGDGVTVVADIYVWGHANTFLKLRCTSRLNKPDSDKTAIHGLLTAIGNATLADPHAAEAKERPVSSGTSTTPGVNHTTLKRQ